MGRIATTGVRPAATRKTVDGTQATPLRMGSGSLDPSRTPEASRRRMALNRPTAVIMILRRISAVLLIADQDLQIGASSKACA